VRFWTVAAPTSAILLILAATGWALSAGPAGGSPLTQGDVDCDLDVDAVDALHVLRVTAGLGTAAVCLSASDVDCDTSADAVDAGATCTAIEDPVPLGYTGSYDNCGAVPLFDGADVLCIITNTLVTPAPTLTPTPTAAPTPAAAS